MPIDPENDHVHLRTCTQFYMVKQETCCYTTCWMVSTTWRNTCCNCRYILQSRHQIRSFRPLLFVIIQEGSWLREVSKLIHHGSIDGQSYCCKGSPMVCRAVGSSEKTSKSQIVIQLHIVRWGGGEFQLQPLYFVFDDRNLRLKCFDEIWFVYCSRGSQQGCKWGSLL